MSPWLVITTASSLLIDGARRSLGLEGLLLNINTHTYWCSQTKVLVISSPNLPTPPPDYFHLWAW
jgi:hypothetical protein